MRHEIILLPTYPSLFVRRLPPTDNRDSSLGIETRLRAGRPRRLSSISGRDKRFFSSPQHPDELWGPPSLLFNGYQGVMQQAREAEHLPPSGAEVKNGGAIYILPDISSWRGA
jgi:hypothetical protein